MGRIARQYLETSFFHVMVQGINKEYIFKNERYINRYIQLIREEIPRDNLKIIAFCIMNNHAHFLINTQKIEFSKKNMLNKKRIILNKLLKQKQMIKQDMH